MDKQRKEAWRKCLILWEALSVMPTENSETFISQKTKLVEKLGFARQRNDCPMCEIYFDEGECTFCPIKPKFSHTNEEVPCRHIRCPYRQYSDRYMHDQILAELFYKWLIALAKEEGYKPDFNLKYW